MRSSLGRINITACAQKIDVVHRISIRYYYRIADNILKQADIFREEGNFIDLYVMLLRFSSLIYETIPCHRDYKTSPQNKKVWLKMKLLNAVNELEEIKPKVLQKIDELNRKNARQANCFGLNFENNSFDSLQECPSVRRNTLVNPDMEKVLQPAVGDLSCQPSRNHRVSHSRTVVPQFQRQSLGFPCPKEETLSKHSILGANGLLGHWQPPMIGKGVKYPCNIDFSPVDIPRLHLPVDDEALIQKNSGHSEQERPCLEPTLPLNINTQIVHAEEPCSLISFEADETLEANIFRQPSPPPVRADVQDLIPALSPQITGTKYEFEKSIPDKLVQAESPLQLHISTTMMENFLRLAKSNTDKNLETCGILAGSLKNRKFYISTLIIPKQESTSDTATNEEEIFHVQDKQSLFPLGWIHTHPSQSCFMSSVDVHTHYSYQIMLPEAIAIVMAPRDASRKHGIFRLTVPGGMSVVRRCEQRGFHSHEQPTDGDPIYGQCTDVYMNPNLEFNVVDLRLS